MYIAAQNGNAKATQLLISHGADVNKARNNGTTPLSIAVQNGHTEVVKELLAANADPEQ